MKKLFKSKLSVFLFLLTFLVTQCFFVFNTRTTSSLDNDGNSNSTEDVSVTVLESDSHHTVVKFDINNFSKDLVNINNKSYYNINCEGTSLPLEEGAPELPRICRNIVIPNDADVKLNVISSEYKDYKNIPIAPSKGSITRDKNPEDIPYKLGKEYKNKNFYPSELVSFSEPFIMRELRGTTITLNAFQYKPKNETLRVYKSVTVEIITDGKSSVNSLTTSRSNKTTSDFEPAYSNTFINYSNLKTPTHRLMNNPSETGSMLIISYDQFSSAMNSFINWKNSRGINTTLVNMSTVSSSNNPTEIKNYIQNYYNQHPELTYVLLVGDYAHVSSPTYSTGVSDPTYTKVAGSDDYPDIYVGRFSAESIADVETQVQRSIEFEQNGYNTAAWFKKGVGIASDEGSGETDIQQMDSIKSKLLNAGYTQVDSIYDPGASASSVTNSLNQGRGIINYCGHGAENYWVTTGFSNTNIKNLQNPGQLPFIISVSCVSGKFQSGTCFAETWLRSKNSNGNPIGAIGTLMSTVNQPWIPPMNGQDGIIDLLCNNSRVSLGGLCYSGETRMLDNGTSSDLLTFNTWTLFGDPSIQILPDSTNPTDPTDPEEPADPYEPNDSTSQAYTINSGVDYSSYIYSNTDVDYYKVTTNKSGVISATLTNLPYDYDLYLYNSSGKRVASSTKSSTSNESISYSARTLGTYYLKVVGYNGAHSTSTKYNLNASYPIAN
ncbi:C25 family cysteine peptidase [Clostridium sp. UBA7339]|uniref:C25 family cysteine peptidase n=1 Tax=Clostridium sp. UBA7339 TaxID=1946376 RepID=UPI003216549A